MVLKIWHLHEWYLIVQWWKSPRSVIRAIKLIQPTEAECRHTLPARLGHLLCLCKSGKWGRVKITIIVILQENNKMSSSYLSAASVKPVFAWGCICARKVMMLFHPLSSYKFHHNLQAPGVLKPYRGQVAAAGQHFRIGKTREIQKAQNLQVLLQTTEWV